MHCTKQEGAVFAIKRAMESEPGLKITLPNPADEQMIRKLFEE